MRKMLVTMLRLIVCEGEMALVKTLANTCIKDQQAMVIRFVFSSAFLLSILAMLSQLDVKAQSSDQASSGGSIFSIVEQRSNGSNKNASNSVQNSYNNSIGSPQANSAARGYGGFNYGGNSGGVSGGATAGGAFSGGVGNNGSGAYNLMPSVAPSPASGASAKSVGSYTFGGNQNVNPVRQQMAPPAVAQPQPQFQRTFQDSSSSTISGDRWGLSTNFPIPMKTSDIDQFSGVYYDSPGYSQSTNHDELQKVRDYYGIK